MSVDVKIFVWFFLLFAGSLLHHSIIDTTTPLDSSTAELNIVYIQIYIYSIISHEQK